jgi:hypothetical protein
VHLVEGAHHSRLFRLISSSFLLHDRKRRVDCTGHCTVEVARYYCVAIPAGAACHTIADTGCRAIDCRFQCCEMFWSSIDGDSKLTRDSALRLALLFFENII